MMLACSGLFASPEASSTLYGPGPVGPVVLSNTVVAPIATIATDPRMTLWTHCFIIALQVHPQLEITASKSSMFTTQLSSASAWHNGGHGAGHGPHALITARRSSMLTT